MYSSCTNKANIYSYSIFVQQMYWLQDNSSYLKSIESTAWHWILDILNDPFVFVSLFVFVFLLFLFSFCFLFVCLFFSPCIVWFIIFFLLFRWFCLSKRLSDYLSFQNYGFERTWCTLLCIRAVCDLSQLFGFLIILFEGPMFWK